MPECIDLGNKNKIFDLNNTEPPMNSMNPILTSPEIPRTSKNNRRSQFGEAWKRTQWTVEKGKSENRMEQVNGWNSEQMV
jgi:hypothetical protein